MLVMKMRHSSFLNNLDQRVAMSIHAKEVAEFYNNSLAGYYSPLKPPVATRRTKNLIKNYALPSKYCTCAHAHVVNKMAKVAML